MKRIYMDYAATSPMKSEVLEAMRPYFMEIFGNPSSIHKFGRQARGALDEARKNIANFLNCSPTEIIFTSGGTEADNLAIRGIINSKFQFKIFNEIQNSNVSNIKNSDIDLKLKIKNLILQKPHIITSAFEHHAVLSTCEELEKQGLAEVTYIKPDNEGIIHVDDIEKAIRFNTILISIMYVNNEIGTVQPISEIGMLTKKLQATSYKLFFHTDAVQAVEYQEMDVEKLGVDMLSLSAHKFGGPKGVGLLYVRKGTPLDEIQTGGGQEFRKRAGTENVASIIGLATAIQLLKLKTKNPSASLRAGEKLKTIELRDYFIKEVMEKIPDVILNGSKERRNPNNVNLSFKYIEGESILLNLDLVGVAASSGSACTSGSLEPSHVLLAIGLKHEDAHGSIRFTLGEKTTKEEIDFTVGELIKIVKRLRSMSPFGKQNDNTLCQFL